MRIPKKTATAAPPITISTANRLFGQRGYDFLKPFLALVNDKYGAPLEPLDFKDAPDKARLHINDWVAERTKQRIKDLIPQGGITPDSRLVLANAIYLKAAWESEFEKNATAPRPFHVEGKEQADVPTMTQTITTGYSRTGEYTAVTLPYVGDDLQFLILLPNSAHRLPALEKHLSAKLLSDCAKLKRTKISLYLPKFKIEPPTMELASQLQSLGMKQAFDIPHRSANFDHMARVKSEDYLYISEVFHKTFLSLDENGTEAAAATAMALMSGAAIMREAPPIDVHVDHPFIFAIQHRSSGACIFLGRITDPR